MSLRIAIFVFLLLSSVSFFGQTIFDAARNGNLQLIDQMERLRPDTLNAVNEAGFTPLILAVYHGQKDIVSYLLKKKIQIDYLSPEGTALMAACYKNDLTTATLLVTHGANTNLRTAEGSSALLFSVLGGNTALVKLLLEHGADKHTTDGNNVSLLSHAQKRGFSEIVILLSN